MLMCDSFSEAAAAIHCAAFMIVIGVNNLSVLAFGDAFCLA